jgi:hypothetical protein
MRRGSLSRVLAASALAALLALPALTGASPISAESEAPPPARPDAWALLAPEALLRSDAALDAAPESLRPAADPALGILRGAGMAAGLASGIDIDPAAATLREQLRSFINVERLAGGPPAAAPPGRGPAQQQPRDEFAGVDAFAAADEWMRDTVQTLVQAALRPEINAQGKASFSVLGMGEFSVTVAGDRSSLSLNQGNELLFVAHRANPWVAGGTRYPESLGSEPLLSEEPVSVPKLREAIEFVTEAATHPLSLLVYCIMAAYVLLWSLLSKPAKARGRSSAVAAAAREETAAPTPLPRERRQRRVHRLHTGGLQRAAIDDAAPSVPEPKQRKRVRIRVRVKKRLSSARP